MKPGACVRVMTDANNSHNAQNFTVPIFYNTSQEQIMKTLDVC
jgi:hypothetical protein